VPKLILVAVARLYGALPPTRRRPYADIHEMTRSRDATRRLRASKLYEPYFDLSPLDLWRRH
jgi:hypothetical protein